MLDTEYYLAVGFRQDTVSPPRDIDIFGISFVLLILYSYIYAKEYSHLCATKTEPLYPHPSTVVT